MIFTLDEMASASYLSDKGRAFFETDKPLINRKRDSFDPPRKANFIDINTESSNVDQILYSSI